MTSFHKDKVEMTSFHKEVAEAVKDLYTEKVKSIENENDKDNIANISLPSNVNPTVAAGNLQQELFGKYSFANSSSPIVKDKSSCCSTSNKRSLQRQKDSNNDMHMSTKSQHWQSNISIETPIRGERRTDRIICLPPKPIGEPLPIPNSD